jgi:hypothetical protein
MNYDLIYYFSMTQSQELEPKLHISAPVPVKSFGSLRLLLQLRLHNNALQRLLKWSLKPLRHISQHVLA